MTNTYSFARVGEHVSSISEPFKPLSSFAFPVNTSDVYAGSFSFIPPTEVRSLKGQFKKAYKVGDILFSEIRPANKRFVLVRSQDECENHVASTKLMVLRCGATMNAKFFYCWLKSEAVLRELQHLAESRSGTFPQITYDVLAKLKMPVPSLSEQEQIASLLGALDDKIETNYAASTLIEKLIFSWFKKYFGVMEFDEGGAPLSSLFGINMRRSLKRGTPAIKVSMGDLPTDSGIITSWSMEPASGGQRFINGDVLFARITPCLENGKTAVVDMLSQGEVGFGSTEFIVLSPRGSISTAWIYALCRQPKFREICARNMNGTSGRQRLSANFFDEYRVTVPSQEKLDQFNAYSENFMSMMSLYRNQNRVLSELRDALLPELMSGRMHVDQANRLVMQALNPEETNGS